MKVSLYDFEHESNKLTVYQKYFNPNTEETVYSKVFGEDDSAETIELTKQYIRDMLQGKESYAFYYLVKFKKRGYYPLPELLKDANKRGLVLSQYKL